MAPSNTDTKVVTGKVRLSYCHLFEPYAQKADQEKKYSCTILVPKSDTATINKILAAQKAALEAGKEKTFKGSIPKVWKSTFRDADSPEEEETLEKNPSYADHYFMSVSNKQKPGVVDQNVQPIVDAFQVYSGCYARVSINAFPYNTNGNRGVSFGLNHVQFLEDGEPLGGSIGKAEDDFDAVEDSLI